MAMLLGVLLLAFVSLRACGSSGDDVSSERAVELSRAAATFAPDRTQVRLVQRGIPPRHYWAVSLYDVNANGVATRVEVFLVDRRTGKLSKS